MWVSLWYYKAYGREAFSCQSTNELNKYARHWICPTFNVREAWLRTGEGTIFENEPDRFTELASATFRELKPVYQEYILKQMDQLLIIQNEEKKQNEHEDI